MSAASAAEAVVTSRRFVALKACSGLLIKR